MSEQRTGARRAGTAFSLMTAGALLISCGASSAEEAPSYTSNQNAAEFVAGLLAEGKVQACLGQASLRGEGHVRTSPNSRYGGNLVTAYSNPEFNQTHNVVVRNPQHMSLDNKNSDSSHDWYVAQLPNGELAFVNRDALVNPDAIVCNTTATLNAPGEILVDPAQ